MVRDGEGVIYNIGMSGALNSQILLLIVGWTTGISVYLTVAILGLAGSMGYIDLPGRLEMLQHPAIILLAIGLYMIEFLADKIPAIDSLWDAFHIWIRPASGVILGAMAGTEYGPLAEVSMGIITGTIALQTAVVKSSTRLAINTSPEPFSNVIASVAEDAAVIGIFWFFIQHPIWAAVIVVLVIVGSFFLLRLLWKFVKKLFSATKPKPLPNEA